MLISLIMALVSAFCMGGCLTRAIHSREKDAWGWTIAWVLILAINLLVYFNT